MSTPEEQKMVPRSIRVPKPLWDEARAAADSSHDNLSEVVRAALQRYVKTQARKGQHGPGKGH